MNTAERFYNSSVGQKLLTGFTGLFLCIFLIEHLLGNLLLLIHDSGKTFDAYSEFMSHNFIIRTIEIGLFAGFGAHIAFGVRLWLANRRARPQKYALNRPSENSSLSSRLALVTGSIVLIFLIVHLRTFFVPARFAANSNPSMFMLVKTAFQSPLYVGFYLVALALLGYHLHHGFQSAMQTFGLRTERYRSLIDFVGAIFWLVIPIGYAVLPAYFLWSHWSGGE